ncbi:alpha-1,2-rhamnosyltransferase [Desulfurella multipotens]|uniref:Alpha-1,2-rhamnosyltransferase n=1 Tax=Desulfurella multipotens TaxID=79269 RepID=A0A1G6QWF3_9BACT|nr:alpha-1,2-rhamnosyltransferase [Desulfurella multipotens]
MFFDLVNCGVKVEKPKNIFIDCTATYYTGLNTGIQRVVRNIIARVDYIETNFGIKCTPVILKEGQFIPISKEDLLNKKPDPKVLKAKVLLSKILPSKVYFFAKNLYGRLFLFFAKPSIKANPIVPQKGDIILGIDVFWELGLFEAIIKYKKQFGIFFILLIYDIIPLMFPKYYRDQTPKKFKANFKKTDVFDAIVTTSHANVYQIKKLSENEFSGISKKLIDVFSLGSDIKPLTQSVNHNEHIEDIVKNSKIFLMVGTLEPRKNHNFVLDAFEKIWENDLSKKLIIVGRIGWLCENTLKRIKSSKYYNKNLFMFNFLNDEDLSYLYKNAAAVIVASTIEGFGLPLAEAMYYNVPVIASDIDVFREIGGSYPIYFNLSSIDSLVDAINNVKPLADKTQTIKLTTWDDSATQLIDKTLILYNQLRTNSEAFNEKSTDNRH